MKQQQAQQAEQQNMQMQQMQIQMQQAALQAQQQVADAEMAKAMATQQNGQLKEQINALEAQLQAVKDSNDQDLKRAELQSKMALELTKLEVQAKKDLSQQNEANKAPVQAVGLVANYVMSLFGTILKQGAKYADGLFDDVAVQAKQVDEVWDEAWVAANPNARKLQAKSP